MRFSRFPVGMLVLVLCLPVWAQQTATTSAQGSVPLQRALGALAGGTSIADVTLTGTARRLAGSDDETGTVVLKALATGEARADFSFPSGTRSEVRVNSQKGPLGQWIGPDGKPQVIAEHNLFVDSAWFFPGLMLGRVISSQTSVLTFVANETRDGHAVEHLSTSRQFGGMDASVSALMQHLSQTEIYLDSSTFLPTAISFNIHPDKDARRDVPVEIRFSDYRTVNGAQVPFHTQRYLNGVLALDLQFDTVVLNNGLTTSTFNIQ